MCTCWNQVALANDVGRNVEELLSYLAITVKVDFSGSLLCVQQVRPTMHVLSKQVLCVLIRRHGYFAFCVATIQGWGLFLWHTYEYQCALVIYNI